MNRYEIALGIKPPPRKTLHKRPMHESAEKINKAAEAMSMDEWIRIRNRETGDHESGLAYQFAQHRQRIAELERQHIMADQEFSNRFIRPAAQSLARQIDQDAYQAYWTHYYGSAIPDGYFKFRGEDSSGQT